MKGSRTLLPLLTAIITVPFLLAACTDAALSPVFYALERERELFDDRGMDDKARVSRVVAAGSRLFAAATLVYWRDDAPGERWQAIAPPPVIANARCNQIEYFDAAGTQDIVAWFYNANDVYDNGLFRLDLAGSPPAVWTPVDTGLSLTDPRVRLLKTVNGQLSVGYSHLNPETVYSLYSVDTGYAFALTSIVNVPERIIDVEFGDGAYWVATEPNASLEWLSTGPTLLGLLADPNAPTMSVARPAGALYHLNGNLYASGENGLIHFRADLTDTWSTPTGDAVKVSNVTVRFTRFTRAESGYLFVGTEGYGYYRFPEDPTAQPRADLDRQPSYNIGGLRGGAVHSFLFVPAGALPDVDTLFACTFGNGLWRADYDSGSTELWPWVQE